MKYVNTKLAAAGCVLFMFLTAVFLSHSLSKRDGISLNDELSHYAVTLRK